MSTLSSPVAHELSKPVTTGSAASDDKVGIMTTLDARSEVLVKLIVPWRLTATGKASVLDIDHTRC